LWSEALDVMPDWLLVAALVALPAAPLTAVAVILRLCESSWGKRPGELGSRGFLLAAVRFSLPLLAAIVWAAVSTFSGSVGHRQG
jgi:hypothetical protein